MELNDADMEDLGLVLAMADAVAAARRDSGEIDEELEAAVDDLATLFGIDVEAEVEKHLPTN